MTPQQEALLRAKRRALRDTISYAEGTWNSGTNSPDYTMRYGDRSGEGSLDLTKPHPTDVRNSIYGGKWSSNASGAYQFKDDTWGEFNGYNNAVMSPANQDAAVDRLIDKRIGYDYNKPFREQSHLLSGTWASIPTREGVSAYGQPTPHSTEELGSFYDSRVKALTPPPAPIKPMTSTDENRPFGTEAILNGQPVFWGGKDYLWQQPESFKTITPPAPTPQPGIGNLFGLIK